MNMRTLNGRLLAVAMVLTGLAWMPAHAQEKGGRAAAGEFVATRLDPAPTMDGKVSPGEWDRALTVSGMMTPFEHQLQTAETTISLGYDASRFYFLFRCLRGNVEWRLTKGMRENDSYEFGDPSVEVWVTPPTLVPETYQNILTTYPAVFDNQQVPSRGYTAMGWKGGWEIGVSESETDYIIEASIPVRDFGFETVKAGDVWRFLLCRTCQGAQPRAQASWSITQGFAEIPQHPPVRFADDEAVLQVFGVTSLFTGKYSLPMAVAAPRGQDAEVAIEVRIQKGLEPAADDLVQRRSVQVKAGQRQELTLTGDVGDLKKGCATITATRKGGALLYRHHLPFEVNGWTPAKPARPADAPAVEELAVQSMYGPETSTLLVKADIFDLPGREKVASGTMRVLDPAGGKPLCEAPLSAFREWYATAQASLNPQGVPVMNFAKLNAERAKRDAVAASNAAKLAKGDKPDPLPELPAFPPRQVTVEVTVADEAGQPIKTATRQLDLIRYSAEWMNNSIGITDQVIPPWTAVTCQAGKVGVWNRSYEIDALGLARRIANGGVSQIESMRLVAVTDGKETVLTGAPPRLDRLVPAAADLTGQAEGAGLRVTASTRIEFDGFVRLDYTVGPAAESAKLDKLYLEVILPEAEATHFCSTAGGWAATHDVTPERWSSQSSASGMLKGDFVPYVWLTNSERAFLWFADSDRGWIHDPDKALPTIETTRADGHVTLRVHFIEIPSALDKPVAFTWGWQCFPSRPLPDGWRATFCANSPPMPHTTNTYFWADADWAVLWPYYCSPFPWSMEKSRAELMRTPPDSPHRPCVGSIAHSIGRYMDYERNQFPGLAVDWAAVPGQIGNSDVTASKGPNDFRLWHYQRWVREARFRGIYVDENYLGLEENFLTGTAYFRPDGGLQRAYNYLGLREYVKRMKVMFRQNGVAEPNLWQHITSGAAYHAWFGDVFYEGENVEPTDLNFDYLEVLPAGRLRSIGSSVCAGGVMTMMAQAQRHSTVHVAKHLHQFVGWCMAHDVMPESQGNNWPQLCEVARLYDPGVKFLPYWKPDTPAKTPTKDCLVSVHSASDRHILWIVNTAREDHNVEIVADLAKLGLDPAKALAVDAESGARVALGDTGRFTLPVAARDYRPVLLVRRGALEAAETLRCSFEGGVEAEQALGSNAILRNDRGGGAPVLTAADGGGHAALCGDGGLVLLPHLNLVGEAGGVSFDGQVTGRQGDLLVVGNTLTVQVRGGKDPALVLQRWPADRRQGDGKPEEEAAAPCPAVGWHRIALAWKDGKAALSVDGQPVAGLASGALAFTPDNVMKWNDLPRVVIGARGTLTAIDNLRCTR